jgi:outer membrane receptor protein involved in Fe transport
VDETHRWALSVKKAFSTGWFEGSAVEVGARNLFDEEPPLSASGNYLAALHESFGRSWYFNLTKNL